MIPSEPVRALASRVRETGLCARLGAALPPAPGMACAGAIVVRGPDALRFLHSQVTNEAEGLAPGFGNFSARVTRTGQLVDLFSVHRLADAPAPMFVLVAPRERIPALHEDLEASHFADDVVIEDVSAQLVWLIVQGPGAPAVLEACVGVSADALEAAPAYAVQPIVTADGPEGGILIKRSLTGDVGFLLALPSADPKTESFVEAVLGAARTGDLETPEPQVFGELLELLRVEAGGVRIGPDTAGRKRILPETGLEQQAVSYSKGCYVGQEVIARVRTYGALPFALRGLVFDSDSAGLDWDRAAALLAALPEPGADIMLEDADGAQRKIGQWASRTLSPVTGSAVAYAYIDKKHRTPGNVHRLVVGDMRPSARVALLPFYSAPDQAGRVATLYDQAVHAFARGNEDEALSLLEQVLGLDPAFSDGYEAMGVMLGRSERFHEAIDIFKRLEEIAPNEAMVNTNLSLYFMKIGEREAAEDQAAKAMQKSMAKHSGRAVDEAQFDEVLAEQKRGDATRKKAMFEQVLEIDADDGVALFGLGTAHSVLEEWEAALRLLTRASEVDAENSAVFLARGKALEKLGRSADAEPVYRQGMEVASRKGDLMPLKEMEHRVLLLSGARQDADSALT
jgi:folate-binding protein YgfZ